MFQKTHRARERRANQNLLSYSDGRATVSYHGSTTLSRARQADGFIGRCPRVRALRGQTVQEPHAFRKTTGRNTRYWPATVEVVGVVAVAADVRIGSKRAALGDPQPVARS